MDNTVVKGELSATDIIVGKGVYVTASAGVTNIVVY